MHIVSYVNGVEFTYTKSTGSRQVLVEPGIDYVFSNLQRTHVAQDKAAADQVFRQSYLEARLPAFRADMAGGRGERLVFYAGAGGFGDQIMAWPAVRFLHRLGYAVDVLVDPHNEPLWDGLDFVGKVMSLPVPLRDLNPYKHAAIFEFVTNADGHPGQLHPTDNLLHRMGVDPKIVDDADKRVPPVLTVEETLETARWADYGFVQLASSNPLRNLPPKESVELAARLPKETGFPWVAIADTFLAKEYSDLCEKAGIRIVGFDSVRLMMAAAIGARLLVGPDSFFMHVRGMASLPAVAYFGALPPQFRVKYYPTVSAVWKKELCRLAPCFIYTASFPPWCPGAKEGRCLVAAGAVDGVLEAVKKCLGSVSNP